MLGVTFSSDADLSLEKHVSKTYATSSYIRKSLDDGSAATLVHAYVYSIDYCNAVYAGARGAEDKLQRLRVLNAAAGVVPSDVFRSLVRRSGTRCLTGSEIRRVVLSFLRQSSLVSTNVTKALEVFLNDMCYPRFTYLLTYLCPFSLSQYTSKRHVLV